MEKNENKYLKLCVTKKLIRKIFYIYSYQHKFIIGKGGSAYFRKIIDQIIIQEQDKNSKWKKDFISANKLLGDERK